MPSHEEIEQRLTAELADVDADELLDDLLYETRKVPRAEADE